MLSLILSFTVFRTVSPSPAVDLCPSCEQESVIVNPEKRIGTGLRHRNIHQPHHRRTRIPQHNHRTTARERPPRQAQEIPPTVPRSTTERRRRRRGNHCTAQPPENRRVPDASARKNHAIHQGTTCHEQRIDNNERRVPPPEPPRTHDQTREMEQHSTRHDSLGSPQTQPGQTGQNQQNTDTQVPPPLLTNQQETA